MYLAANRSSPTLPGLLPAPLCSSAAINHGQQTKEKDPAMREAILVILAVGTLPFAFGKTTRRDPMRRAAPKAAAPPSPLAGEAARDTFCRNKPCSESQHRFQLGFCSWIWHVGPSSPSHRAGAVCLYCRKAIESNPGENSAPTKGEGNPFWSLGLALIEQHKTGIWGRLKTGFAVNLCKPM